MLLIIIIFPILNIIFSGLYGRYLGIIGSKIISFIMILLSLIILLILSIELYQGQESINLNLFNLLDIEYIRSVWSIELNHLSVSLLIPVVLISFLVHSYSIYYMASDPHIQRFLCYLSLFTLSIIILVISKDILQLFIGWELIGMSSFLLISFWFTRLDSSLNAMKAFIINRVGDIFICISLYFILIIYNSLNFNVINSISININNLSYFLSILILFSSIAKSAQIGFNTWLPDAISGPTPVSALIHAATLVTAGAYLIIKLNIILNLEIFWLISLVGGLTALIAGTFGLLENDFKRVIAFSTCSQIGYLFLSIGLNQFNFSLYHIINHAFFKALLFLSAGLIIHAINENQDLRKIGGLRFYLPIIYIIFLIASISLIAMPFLSGFYSKEIIIESAFVLYTFNSFYIYLLSILAAILTAYYSIRILKLSFYNQPNYSQKNYISIHQPNLMIILPLVVLFILSIIFGYVFKDFYLGLGSNFLSTNINLTNLNNEIEFNINYLIKLLPLFLTLLGSLIGYFQPNLKLNLNIYRFLSAKWILDNLYNYITFKILNLGIMTSKVLDRGIIENLGPYGISQFFINLDKYFYSGNIVYYSFLIILNIFIILLLSLIKKKIKEYVVKVNKYVFKT